MVRTLRSFIASLLLFSFWNCADTTDAKAWNATNLNLGPLYDEFSLTLAPGRRVEAAGPLYYYEENDTQRQWATPPLFSWTQDHGVESEEFDFLYPLLTYDRFGEEYRFEILQLFAFSGGQTQDETMKRRFTLFPIYFQ